MNQPPAAAADAPEEIPLPFEARPVLLLFSDDSTLFFALRMRDCLRAADPDLKIHMGWVVEENALSYRQMEQLLPEGPDLAIHGKGVFRELLLDQRYKAILTSRVFGALGGQLRRPEISAAAGRACVLAFLGGLDFFPQNGYFRRRNCDGVYLFPASEIPVYEKRAANWEDRMWQEVGFGHPTFLRPEIEPPADLATRRDIYFFTQALSPTSKRGRLHMLEAMAAIARANPDHRVWIKLRHLPHENQQHLHLEKHDYPGLLKELQDPPANLRLTACTMDEALENAALGITCTSTAAIDVLRAGVPCMVHLDFVDNYVDPLVEPMRRLFAQSGVITSLEDMLNLRAQAPNPEWVEDMFCPRDLGTRVLQTITRFNGRAFQVEVL
ncbi:hypothetical protein RSK20926_01127 [Roseobacter sp. SK209-2-6]|uniref:DUF6716 putative glycosyltransferase n=1 Tax=Roseobacter sp. SK209-2-6 TaxID=388739 RepID=UPI0000F3F1F2|nr:DUF6716 putative glycosyltransferase [Roseobacter sp. SK209-2-6]EBA14554.1 hypothetical protein RSK20926_01127 [Roseobacter sp. SK209-2-6]